MNNPASELLSIFNTWSARAGTRKAVAQHDVRQMGDYSAFVPETRRAFECILETEKRVHLAGAIGHNVEEEMEFLPHWYLTVLGYPTAWSAGPAPEDIISSHSRSVLRSFARHLDSHPELESVQHHRGDLSEDEREDVRTAIEAVLELIKQDKTITHRLGWYMSRLIAEMRLALDDEFYGNTFNLKEASERLWYLLYAAEAESKNMKPAWARARTKPGFFTRFTEGALAGAAADQITNVLEIVPPV